MVRCLCQIELSGVSNRQVYGGSAAIGRPDPERADCLLPTQRHSSFVEHGPGESRRGLCAALASAPGKIHCPPTAPRGRSGVPDCGLAQLPNGRLG
jgi:hypothetical protein